MDYVSKIKEKLQKAGYGEVTAEAYNGGIRLTGELKTYEDVLACGRLAVDKKHSRGVVNDLRFCGQTEKPMRLPTVVDKKYEGRTPDVLIIGGGIVGAAIARELSKYDLQIMVAEKEYDLATAQSSRNDGMIHAGIDLKPKSGKVKYNMRGNRLYDTLSKELDVPIEKCGQCVLYTSRLQKLIYPIIKLRGKMNDIPLSSFSNKQVAGRIPNPGMKYGGFMCWGAGIVSPYLMTVALAESAVQNGAEVCLNTAVIGIENDGKRVLSVTTNRGVIRPKVLINAAGVFSDKIAEQAGDRFFTIHPRKGVEAVIDSKAYGLTDTVVGRFALKSSSGKGHTKGGGVIVTIDHNLLIGPNATELPERENEATSSAELDEVFEKQVALTPSLKRSDIITYFAGTRAATYEEEFIVEKSPVIANLVQAAGIQSPGVTAAPAIAEDVTRYALEILKDGGKFIPKNKAFNPIRKGIPRISELSAEERDALIKQNPDYGVVVCRCEQITKGEILDAIRSPIPAPTLDGIKRRVRAGMGRCQGGFCSPLITAMIAKETGTAITSVTKKGEGSELIKELTKAPEQKEGGAL